MSAVGKVLWHQSQEATDSTIRDARFRLGLAHEHAGLPPARPRPACSHARTRHGTPARIGGREIGVTALLDHELARASPESADRATGYFTTRADARPEVDMRTAGVYSRADPQDLRILDGRDDGPRAKLIAERLKNWKSITNA